MRKILTRLMLLLFIFQGFIYSEDSLDISLYKEFLMNKYIYSFDIKFLIEVNPNELDNLNTYYLVKKKNNIIQMAECYKKNKLIAKYYFKDNFLIKDIALDNADLGGNLVHSYEYNKNIVTITSSVKNKDIIKAIYYYNNNRLEREEYYSLIENVILTKYIVYDWAKHKYYIYSENNKLLYEDIISVPQ